MLELKRWLREFTEEAPWYFWLWAVPIVLLLPFCEYFIVTLAIFTSLLLSSALLKKYKIIKLKCVYITTITSLLISNYIITTELYFRLKNMHILSAHEYYILEPIFYIIYIAFATICSMPFIWINIRQKRTFICGIFKILICISLMSVASGMLAEAILLLTILPFSIC